MEKSTLSAAMTTAVPPKPTNLVFIGGQLRKIPRPRNAFMIFANEHRRHFQAMYPADTNNKISTRLGDAWHNMEKDAKANYFSRARAEDQEHKRKYPFYHYTPSLSKQFKQEMKRVKYVNRIRMLSPSPFVPTPDMPHLSTSSRNLFNRLQTKSTSSIAQNAYQQLPHCESSGTQPVIRPVLSTSTSSFSNSVSSMSQLGDKTVWAENSNVLNPEIATTASMCLKTAANLEHGASTTTEQPLLMAETLSKAVLDQITPFIQPRSPPVAAAVTKATTTNKCLNNLVGNATKVTTLSNNMTQHDSAKYTLSNLPISSTNCNGTMFKPKTIDNTASTVQQYQINDLEPLTYMVDNTSIRHLPNPTNSRRSNMAQPMYVEDSNGYLNADVKRNAGPVLLAAALTTPPANHRKEYESLVAEPSVLTTDKTNTLICDAKQQNCLLGQSIVTLPPIESVLDAITAAAAAAATTAAATAAATTAATTYQQRQATTTNHLNENNHDLYHTSDRDVIDQRISQLCENSPSSASTSQCILGAFKLLLDDSNTNQALSFEEECQPRRVVMQDKNSGLLTDPQTDQSSNLMNFITPQAFDCNTQVEIAEQSHNSNKYCSVQTPIRHSCGISPAVAHCNIRHNEPLLRHRNDLVLTKQWPREDPRDFVIDNLASTTNLDEMPRASKTQFGTLLEAPITGINCKTPSACPAMMFGPCKSGLLNEMEWEVTCIVSPESTQKEQRVS